MDVRNNMWQFKVKTLFLLISMVGECCAMKRDVELTILVDPGKQECFYQHLEENQSLTLEYLVISGGQGGLDITFKVFSPDGLQLISDYKGSEESHQFNVKDAGVHSFCLDNTFSAFNHKIVFLAIYVDEADEDWLSSNGIFEEENDDNKIIIDSIKHSLFKAHSSLTEVQQIQDMSRSNEARDRHLLERNSSRVTLFSIIQIITMIFVSLVQVLVVRGLLDSKSKLSRIWSRLFNIL
ncbi:transmembrane emp24 domain-containing protein 1 [Nilaparvata lugens]|uniref:transmembrane emp24 domain-containing protein 1 n=1 Tax=Nilaparvata lugens TaxID=108931 RepID=UPI000B987533|nr:transmembrane emp24 domain-containing protein 1 [Nilaparvata lugens]